jgi:hypothetical protein
LESYGIIIQAGFNAKLLELQKYKLSRRARSYYASRGTEKAVDYAQLVEPASLRVRMLINVRFLHVPNLHDLTVPCEQANMFLPQLRVNPMTPEGL